MSRINTNISSLIAQRVLVQNQMNLTRSLERLSTGLRINRGSDGPAELIASEQMRAEKERISAALANAQRADQVVSVAEGSLGEISDLLIEIQNLVSATASDTGLTTEEKEANQAEVDEILKAIDRIVANTTFQGTRLLNGAFDFHVQGLHGNVEGYRLRGAAIGDEDVAVQTVITASAHHAALYMSTGGALDGDADEFFTFELAGTKGSRQFSFASGTSLDTIVASVNAFTSVTGVSAATQSTGIVFKSTKFGSDQWVSIRIVDDGDVSGAVHLLSSNNENQISTANATAFASVTTAVRDEGQDVAGSINGQTARGSGKTLSVNNDGLNVELDLTDAGAIAVGSITALTITGGGAKFNIGPTIDVGSEVRLGLGNLAARNLGTKADGFLDELGSGKTYNLIDGDLDTASEIVEKAIAQVAGLRGQLGSFQAYTLGSTINALNVAFENVSAAESAIRDTDFAAETASMTRAQILVAATSQVLSIANAQPQSILTLLQ